MNTAESHLHNSCQTFLCLVNYLRFWMIPNHGRYIYVSELEDLKKKIRNEEEGDANSIVAFCFQMIHDL